MLLIRKCYKCYRCYYLLLVLLKCYSLIFEKMANILITLVMLIRNTYKDDFTTLKLKNVFSQVVILNLRGFLVI